MHRFWVFARLGLLAVLFALAVCSCSKQEPRSGMGEPPPGNAGQNHPRFKGIPEEISDGHGGYNKKIWHKVTPGKPHTAPPWR